MSQTSFYLACFSVALVFTLIFSGLVVPELIKDGDILGAFAAGFVNPYATGYSIDVILCWVVLAIWVFYEARVNSIRYGWVCLLLGIVPGVVVGLALYLILRSRQLNGQNKS